MSWAAVAGAACGVIGGGTGGSTNAPKRTTCAGCGAALTSDRCSHCRRERDAVEEAPARRRESSTYVSPAPAPYDFTPSYSPPPAPAPSYSPPAPSPSFSSGGGGDYGGGGSSGDW